MVGEGRAYTLAHGKGLRRPRTKPVTCEMERRGREEVDVAWR